MIATLTNFNALRKAVARAISPETFPVWSPPPQSLTKWGLMDSQGDVKVMVEAFKSLAFMCVNVRATEVANRAKFTPYLIRGVDEVEALPVKHPLSQLLRNPNPVVTPFHIWYNAIAYLDLAGNSYWWTALDKTGTPRILWPIPSQNIRIVGGNPKLDEPIIKGYNIWWNTGVNFYVDAKEIVHLKHPNPSNPYFYGASRLMKAAREIDIDSYIGDYDREFFGNDAMPASVVIFDHELQPDTRAAFEAEWRDKFQRKPGQMGYLEAGAKIEQLSHNQELGFKDTRLLNMKRVQGVFGVPDSKIMLTEQIKASATVEVEDYVFQKDTIDPLIKMIAEQLTSDLARPFFGDEYIIMHESTIPKDLKLVADLDKAYIDMGVLTINEVRKRDGDDPVNGGDEPLVDSRKIPLSQASAQVVETHIRATDDNAPPPPGPPEPDKRRREMRLLKSGDVSNAMLNNRWKLHERTRMKYEARLTSKLKRAFNGVKTEVIAKIKGKAFDPAQTKDSSVERGYSFNVQQFLDTITPIIGQESLRILENAFDDFVDEYGVQDLIFAPNSGGVVSAIARINAKTRTIPETLHDDLTRTLDEGIRMKETEEQLAERVAKFFDGTNDFRAIRIARTVSNYAVNEGNAIAARDSKLFTHKLWVTQRDDRVRDIHAAVDGIEIPIKDKFQMANGDHLDVPGDPMATHGESVINCRCTVFFTKGK